jgi:hypothetical protein
MSSVTIQVENSAFGCDHMIPSVVQMGFILIESGAAIRYPFGEDGICIESVSESQQLGLQLLSAAFEVHEMARDEVNSIGCNILHLTIL